MRRGSACGTLGFAGAASCVRHQCLETFLQALAKSLALPLATDAIDEIRSRIALRDPSCRRQGAVHARCARGEALSLRLWDTDNAGQVWWGLSRLCEA